MTRPRKGPDQSMAMPAVVVFSQPHCRPCQEVERYLHKRQVPFVVRDVLADPEALALLEARGYMSTPVTRIGTHWVAGFRRDALDEALAALGRDTPAPS